MKWPNTRVSALGEPQLVQLLDSTEEALPDWRTAYGGVLNTQTREVELPMPTFAPCPYEKCPECEKGPSDGHR